MVTRKIPQLLFSLLFIITPALTKAQYHVGRIEGEIRGGMSLGIEPYHGGRIKPSYSYAIEGRYNIGATGWDCGLMAGVTTSRRDYITDHVGGIRSGLEQNNRTWIMAATGDYNFRQGNRISPYIGCGLGYGYNQTTNAWIYPSEGSSLVFMPRGGVEIAGFLRLMAEFNVCRKGYNNFALTVGFVLGGRPKK